MENYIKQLIEDIRATGLEIAKLNEVKSITDPEDEMAMGDFSAVEKYIYGEQTPIEMITGIDANLLPPEDKLTHDQMAVLAEELEKLLEVKHFALVFPENLPLHIRYPLIRKFWNEKHVEMAFGTSHIEFCQYEPDNCPYPDTLILSEAHRTGCMNLTIAPIPTIASAKIFKTQTMRNTILIVVMGEKKKRAESPNQHSFCC